jgi:thiamine-monophosphate kinase
MGKTLGDIGEFGLIKAIKNNTSVSAPVLKGIGDDCAVIKYTKRKYLLFTTDMIIEDIHFRLKSAKPEAIGHKALAVNISDIAACGGIPKWAVVSAGISPSISYSYTKRLYSGILSLARRFKIDIVGGDTNASDKLVLSVTLIGEVEKENLVLRSGAVKGDIIALSGKLYSKPDDLTFSPQLKEAGYLVKKFKLNSMIDISDGFLSDLNHILEESKKGAVIYESLIPYLPKTAPIFDVLNQGEQFKLLFTLPKAKLKKLPNTFYPVGEITNSKGIVFVARNGKRKTVSPKGYKHF